jgi:hypothetical protein
MAQLAAVTVLKGKGDLGKYAVYNNCATYVWDILSAAGLASHFPARPVWGVEDMVNALKAIRLAQDMDAKTA